MSFLLPRGGRGIVSRRPQTANSPLRFSGKLPPVRANTLTQFARPGQPVQEKEPPVRANTLTQFAYPGQPVLKKLPPVRANTLTQFAHPSQSGPVLQYYSILL